MHRHTKGRVVVRGRGTPDIGDAVLPLSLMALAFCGVVALRRRKAVKR